MSKTDKVNILMVDDQPGKLLSYEAILGELGENLIKATSGRQALDLLLKNDIAVVLMDVSMPEIDGFELADMIRQHPRFQQTAIIFISGIHLTDLDRLQGYQRGAVDYISVPVNPELLRAKVSVFAELHRKTRQLELRHLSGSLLIAQDEERRRIARELHDGLGQELSAAKMMIDCLPATVPQSERNDTVLAEASESINRAIQQVRSLSHLLHPPLLDEVGLRCALEPFLEGFSKRSGIETSVEVKPSEFPRLKSELETAIFRIVQEGLTNVFRHSGADKASVIIEKSDREIIVAVRDNGKGLAENIVEFRPGSIGIGISGMRQRVKEFGGEIRLHNVHPGALVEVVFPITYASQVLRPAQALTT